MASTSPRQDIDTRRSGSRGSLEVRASVTVVMAVHNGERYVGEALDSVTRQTTPPLETIVVDDGSSDASREVAAACPGVRVVGQERRGSSAARNRAISLALGEFVACLDADDIADPRRLERAARCVRPRIPSSTSWFSHLVEVRFPRSCPPEQPSTGSCVDRSRRQVSASER